VRETSVAQCCGVMSVVPTERDECLFDHVPGQVCRIGSLHPTAAVFREVLRIVVTSAAYNCCH
jgi:hypothetical protein